VHYQRHQRDERSPEDINKNMLKESIVYTVKRVRDNPAKALLVPALCAGYVMFLGALYVNVIVYHARANRANRVNRVNRTNRTTRRKSRY